MEWLEIVKTIADLRIYCNGGWICVMASTRYVC